MLNDEHRRLIIRRTFLERMIDLRNKQLDARTVEADGLRIELSKLTDEVRREKSRADELDGRFENAWRSPYIWLAAGLILGGGTVAIVAVQ